MENKYMLCDELLRLDTASMYHPSLSKNLSCKSFNPSFVSDHRFTMSE